MQEKKANTMHWKKWIKKGGYDTKSSSLIIRKNRQETYIQNKGRTMDERGCIKNSESEW